MQLFEYLLIRYSTINMYYFVLIKKNYLNFLRTPAMPLPHIENHFVKSPVSSFRNHISQRASKKDLHFTLVHFSFWEGK